MGIITNGPTEHQLKKVKKLGLYDYVDPKCVIVSQATGFQKPEKEIFNRIENRDTVGVQIPDDVSVP